MSLLLAFQGGVTDDSETRAPLAEDWQPEEGAEVALDQSVVENEVQALLADIADDVSEIDDLLNQLVEDAPPPDAPDFSLDEIADAEEPTTNLVEDVAPVVEDFLDVLLAGDDAVEDERDDGEPLNFTEDFYDTPALDDADAGDEVLGELSLLSAEAPQDSMEWLTPDEDDVEPGEQADDGWLYAQIVAPVAAVVSEWIARARRRARR